MIKMCIMSIKISFFTILFGIAASEISQSTPALKAEEEFFLHDLCKLNDLIKKLPRDIQNIIAHYLLKDHLLLKNINKELCKTSFTKVLGKHPSFVVSAKYSAEGNLIVSLSFEGAEGNYVDMVKVWDGDSGALLSTLNGHTDRATSAHFGDDATVITSSWDGSVKIWESTTGVCCMTLHHDNTENGLFPRVKLMVNQKIVTQSGMYSTSPGATKIWQIGGIPLTLSRPPGFNYRGFCLAEDKVITYEHSYDDQDEVLKESCKVRVWDSNNGKCLHVMPSIRLEEGGALYYNNKSKLVLLRNYDNQEMQIWDPSKWSLLKKFVKVNGSKFNHAGDKLLTVHHEEGVFRIWDIKTFQEDLCIKGNIGYKGVKFSFDDTIVLSVQSDKLLDEERTSIILRNAHSGDQLAEFEKYNGRISLLAVHPHKYEFITASDDNAIKIWNYDWLILLNTWQPSLKQAMLLSYVYEIHLLKALMRKRNENPKLVLKLSTYPQFQKAYQELPTEIKKLLSHSLLPI